MNLAKSGFDWVVKRFGASTLITAFLIFLVMTTLTALLVRNVTGLDGDLMAISAIVGMAVGWILARSRLRSGWAVLLGLLMGVAVVIVRVGSLFDELADLHAALSTLGWGLGQWPLSIAPLLDRAANLLASLGANLATLGGRVQTWLAALLSGQATFDPVAAALVWAYVMWVLAVWSTWATRRYRHVALALLPVIAVTASTLLYIGDDPKILLMPLAMVLCLLAVVGQVSREAHWRSKGIDFWEGMRLDLAVTSVPLILGILLLATAVPSISIDQVVRWFERTVAQPVAQGRAVVPESLGLKPLPRPVRPLDNLKAPGLPRRHLIGAGPELSRETVMLIRTNELPPPGSPLSRQDVVELAPRYYWRGSTYDRYTGSGWATSDTETIAYQAGQPMITETMTATMTSTHRSVRQWVQMEGERGGLLYAAGTPVAVDHDYEAAWRSSNDLFNVKAPGAEEYQLDVLVPNLAESTLRAAPAVYPNWIKTRYLELPKTLPERVRTLARDLTATAPTPYDRAKAIESYLRTYTYTLDLPAPPPAVDVVDYFLFNLKRGYCDYFATSMVVLARAAGLPARLVVGYATGALDPIASRYNVVEADAHSWPEVYFPEYGWVEFEPTSGRPPITRAPEPVTSTLTLDFTSVEPLMAQQARLGAQRFLAAIGFAGLLMVAALGWFLAERWRLGRLAPATAIARLYARMYGHGRRLDVAQEIGDTPYEFSAALNQRLQTLQPKQPEAWSMGGTDEGADKTEPSQLAPQDQVSRLADLYVRSRYSPHLQDEVARASAIGLWLSLRRRLWRMSLRYQFQRRFLRRRAGRSTGAVGAQDQRPA